MAKIPKKVEEIAEAIYRDNPNISMGKKMRFAWSTFKKKQNKISEDKKSSIINKYVENKLLSKNAEKTLLEQIKERYPITRKPNWLEAPVYTAQSIKDLGHRLNPPSFFETPAAINEYMQDYAELQREPEELEKARTALSQEWLQELMGKKPIKSVTQMTKGEFMGEPTTELLRRSAPILSMRDVPYFERPARLTESFRKRYENVKNLRELEKIDKSKLYDEMSEAARKREIIDQWKRERDTPIPSMRDVPYFERPARLTESFRKRYENARTSETVKNREKDIK